MPLKVMLFEIKDSLVVTRRNLKEVHENSVLLAFENHLKQSGHEFKVIDRPDPPEAIVEIDNQKTWIEVTDAFLDIAHAISLTSRASEDMVHQRDDGRLIYEPDATFRKQLIDVISKKYDKATMQLLRNQLGCGILLVGIFTPFNTARGIVKEESNAIDNLIASKNCNVFDEIYVYDGTGAREFHRIYKQQTLNSS